MSDCDCARCLEMASCSDCGRMISDSEPRFFRTEAAPVDLIHEETVMVGPCCTACATVRGWEFVRLSA